MTDGPAQFQRQDSQLPHQFPLDEPQPVMISYGMPVGPNAAFIAALEGMK
jgi:hypothetical protein